MVDIDIPTGYGIPLADISTGALPVPTMAAIRSDVAQSANTFTQTQTFDPVAGIQLGSKLKTTYADGFAGQRAELTGTDSTVMPYLDIVATSLTGSDVGGATGGLQLHRLGSGAAANREFLAFEISGDLATVPGFKISPWASGTGVLRPVTFWDGTHEVFRIVNEGGTGALRIGDASRLTIQDVGTTSRTVILMQRNGSFSDHRRVYSSTGTTRAYMFFSKNRGSIEAPTAPGSGDLLGDIIFGTSDSGSERSGAFVRATTTEAWAYTTARGTKLGVHTTPATTATAQIQAEFDEPAANEVGILVRVDRAGTKTLSRVSIGAVDSGGAGFRVLRVAN